MKNFILGILSILMIGAFAGAFFIDRFKPAPSPVIPAASSAGSPTVSVPSATPFPTVSDGELIKQALYKKNNWKEGITVTVSTNDGAYASGTVTAQGGGGYFYAAKVGGEWRIVADGNGMIPCSWLADYPAYPKTLIPECYDDVTQQTVTR